MGKYTNMSDSEFVDLLTSKLVSKSWNVGEMVELERRGLGIVSQNQNLSESLIRKKSDFTETMNKALEPYAKQFKLLSESISSFKDLKLENALASNPYLENKDISSQEAVQQIVLREVAETLELSLMELQGIRSQNDRDWFHWSIWIASLVAALASVLALFINS